jgi:phage shock protein PspC (stress-responsive transcriptional regulator)
LEVKIMFCTNCGMELREDDAFCARCGKPAKAGAAPPPPPPREPRRLARRMDQKTIAGVCSGLAAYLGADVTLIRVLWLVLTIFTGLLPGLAVYIVCWIVMPKEYRPAGGTGQVAPVAGG